MKTFDATHLIPQFTQEQEAAVSDISSGCGLRPLTARILVGRGVDTVDAARLFLEPSLERDWLDPEQIPGLADVADSVEEHMRAGKRILVFGDFDVDGITATTISVRGLRALGADVVGLIPHRYEEGYALSAKAIERAMKLHPDLVMTVDCGISCGEEVKGMLAQGLSVAITDHHEPGENVPQGVPVADPKLVADHPSRNLAGAGVALKLICLLGRRMGQPELWRSLTDFAALGTVADLMSLTGENRSLVADGIERIVNAPRTCFSALMALCKLKPEDISSTRLSFSLIPRLNAAGRMGDAAVALDLLMTDDAADAERLAGELEQVNNDRRNVEAELVAQVEAQLDESYADAPVIVAAGEGWHEGVKGIVAGRIARSYERPAIVFGIKDGLAQGSGRTYGGLNLFELAGTAKDLYDKFGGHAAAIGITLPADKLPELERRLCDNYAAFVEKAAGEGVRVDAAVKLEECDVEGFSELERLQPFGNDNPVPKLVACNVLLERRGAVGKQGNHFRFAVSDGVASVPGIYFNAPDIDELVSCEQVCDVLFEPSVDEWQGRFTAKLRCEGIFTRPSGELVFKGGVQERMVELFEQEAQIAETGEYVGIERTARFNTKVVGVTFENRQDVLAGLEVGVELSLVRQPLNEVDPNAVAVQLLDGTQLGYLNRHLARRLAPVMDSGVPYDAAVSAVTGGVQQGQVRGPGPLGVRDPGVVDRSYGVNIVVRRADMEGAAEADASAAEEELRRARVHWSKVDAASFADELRCAMIGSHELHPAQVQTLEKLSCGLSTFTVMATGRGKSLIFHMHAASMALQQGKASIFVYPLRALVADQAYHLQESLGRFGLTCCVLTGESDAEQRDRMYEGLAHGGVDIVLTTPEFLSIHAQRFADTGRIGFVVVDEAHHIGQSRAGNRPAYASLGDALAVLGHPLVLAVTATADDATAAAVCRTLSCTDVVIDPSMRENLHIDDRRDVRNREDYLASLAAAGEKCVVYVNSREQSMKLARALRHRLAHLAPYVAFYNAGLGKADRKRIEDAFREGELRIVISTSAFGEGIDIPDIRHVVLFHLPFNDIEFNQMSGRAGRDGRDSTVHLLYSYGDARINEKILASSAPGREQLVALYRVLVACGKQAQEQGQDAFSCTNAELADKVKRHSRSVGIDDSAVSCGISVFRELGFLETSGRGVSRHIAMVPGPSRMELEDSVRYVEGKEELAEFSEFKNWALSASADELLARFNRPILPEHPDELPVARG